MERPTILVLLTYALTYLLSGSYAAEEKSVLSTILTTDISKDKVKRQSRNYYDYYDYRYGIGRPYERPLYDRLEYARQAYDRPRCGRCDERYDRDDDYDRRDDDRRDSDRRDSDRRDGDRRDSDRRDGDRRDGDRRSHRPTNGNRYDSDEDKYNDRKNTQKNGTEEEHGDKKHDDKDNRPSGSRRGGDRDRDRDRERDRHRYDDRDRYRSDYYDRFLRDRDYYDRPYYEDGRPFIRYPDRFDGFGRFEGYGSDGYRRPGYEDDGYGGYGPSAGRGPHDSFRPWDETYRGQAGWDAGGRGYYFASGRPDAAPATTWGRPEYTRPQTDSGWQNVGYRDPLEYRGTGYSTGTGYSAGTGYPAGTSYRQDLGSYGQASGWHSAGERRPYRDESGVRNLQNRDSFSQATSKQNVYATANLQPTYGQTNHQQDANKANSQQQNVYGQPIGQPYAYGQSTYGKTYQQSYDQSSTTPGTSYLFQREDETTVKPEITKSPS